MVHTASRWTTQWEFPKQELKRIAVPTIKFPDDIFSLLEDNQTSDSKIVADMLYRELLTEHRDTIYKMVQNNAQRAQHNRYITLSSGDRIRLKPEQKETDL